MSDAVASETPSGRAVDEQLDLQFAKSSSRQITRGELIISASDRETRAIGEARIFAKCEKTARRCGD